ncbi:MAG: hypothetical protein L6R42_006553, partial [Xanthoria sp. 1 TBL-2021]
MSSRTSASPPRQPAPSAGPLLPLPHRNLPFRTVPMAPSYLGGIPLPSFRKASEDCLFLDVYVPRNAVEDPSLKLPVISWFFGGAYTFGGKDSFDPVVPFYAGTGMLQQTDGNVIFVASNYR